MDLLNWLAEPKSDRIRTGVAFGCFGAASFGIPLLVVVLAFGAIPHCKTCAAATGGNLIAGLVLAVVFGIAVGVAAAFTKPRLQPTLGRAGSAVVLAIGIAIVAWLSLSPAVQIVTR